MISPTDSLRPSFGHDVGPSWTRSGKYASDEFKKVELPPMVTDSGGHVKEYEDFLTFSGGVASTSYFSR